MSKTSLDIVIEDYLRKILLFIGDDPTREGLLKTPERIRRSWAELYGGYNQDPKKILSTKFEDIPYHDMVTLEAISFFSTCEHHMLPFYGKAIIGYIPNSKIVGISKLARLVECYAHRLQTQEMLVGQIADAIMNFLVPKGCGVIIRAQHMCMVARGVKNPTSVMTTSAMRGCFETDTTKHEFTTLALKGF